MKFNAGLLNENSRLGSIISSKAIQESSERIRKTIDDHLVAVGAAVRIRAADINYKPLNSYGFLKPEKVEKPVS